jgi:hypothetical protein
MPRCALKFDPELTKLTSVVLCRAENPQICGPFPLSARIATDPIHPRVLKTMGVEEDPQAASPLVWQRPETE